MRFSDLAAIAGLLMEVERSKSVQRRVVAHVMDCRCLWLEPGDDEAEPCGDEVYSRNVCQRHVNRYRWLCREMERKRGKEARLALESKLWKAGLILRPNEAAEIKRDQALASV